MTVRRTLQPLLALLPGRGPIERTLPHYIERSQIELMVQLNSVFKSIKKKILIAENEHLERTGFPLSWTQALKTVETIIETEPSVKRYMRVTSSPLDLLVSKTDH